MSSVTKTVKHLIHMGEYESLEVSVSHTIEIPEHMATELVLDALDKTINDALEPELKQAKALADPESYVHDWRI